MSDASNVRPLGEFFCGAVGGAIVDDQCVGRVLHYQIKHAVDRFYFVEYWQCCQKTVVNV